MQIIKDAADEDVFVVEGPTSLCSCFKSFCHCCAGRDIIFRIVELKTDRQVTSIIDWWLWWRLLRTGWQYKQEVEWSSKGGSDQGRQIQHWFSTWHWLICCFWFHLELLIVLPLDIGMKATLLGMTFLIDYLHFEADPTDDIGEDTP